MIYVDILDRKSHRGFGSLSVDLLAKTVLCVFRSLIGIFNIHLDIERRTFIRSLGAVGSLGATVVGTNAVLAASTPVKGTVEAKLITGCGGDESHTVLAHEGTLVVDDAKYRDAFSDWQT
jgi:hypothetical protein